MKRDPIQCRSYMCFTKKIGSLTLVIYSIVYCSHFQKDYMLILMVHHYSKLQYPYQISLSKCKMKRVLRRFLNSLRIEQFDVVVDLTSSPVPTRTNVPTNYIRTSFPYFNKSTSFGTFLHLLVDKIPTRTFWVYIQCTTLKVHCTGRCTVHL